jgi:hypothetical protein
MIGRRVANIIKRFARHRDYMRLVNFEIVRGFDAERKLLRRPSKQQPATTSPAVISSIICFRLRLLLFTPALPDAGVTSSFNTILRSGQ